MSIGGNGDSASMDEMWMLVRALVRKSVLDSLDGHTDPDAMAEELHRELAVLGKRTGQAEDAFRAMVLDEIEAALAERDAHP